MSDYRSKLISSIEKSIVTVLDPEDREKVMRKIIGVLADYEVAERCTDIAVYDNENERILNR